MGEIIPYKRLEQALSLLATKQTNSVTILGKPGIGKSWQTERILRELGLTWVVFRGHVSDAYLYKFLYDNRNELIVFRDVGEMLRRIVCIDYFKALAENEGKREISRLTYSKKRTDLPNKFEFKGQVVFELNSIMKKYNDDLQALFNRGVFVDLVLSKKDIEDVMDRIATTEWQRAVTSEIKKNYRKIGYTNYNLRTQNTAFKIYQMAKKQNKDWKKELALYFDNRIGFARKLFFRFAQAPVVPRKEFVRFLMYELDWSYATAQRKVSEWIFTGQIFSDRSERNANLSLSPFGNTTLQTDYHR